MSFDLPINGNDQVSQPAPQQTSPETTEGSGSVASILKRDRARSWSSHTALLSQQFTCASSNNDSTQHTSARGERPNDHTQHSKRRPNRSRASSSASIPDHAVPDTASLASVMTANAAADRNRARTHSRGSSIRRHDPTSLTRSPPVNGANHFAPLSAASRNRSSPHLPGMLRLSSTYDHGYGFSPIATPSSPVLSATAALALASTSDSRIAPSAAEQPWASFPTSPILSAYGRNDSSFDLPHSAQSLHSHHLRQGSTSYFLPLAATDSPRLEASQDVSAGLSEWAQQTARMHHAAQLLGLHRIFTSRSTPHLPVLDPTLVSGNDFDTPPPYAPQASEQEHELERGANVPAARASTAGCLPADAARRPSTILPCEPPLPPPITIPTLAQRPSGSLPRSSRSPGHASTSIRGSRSGPPSPSASFYGARGMSSISPLPPGLGMRSSLVQASNSPAGGTISPGAMFLDSGDSDGDCEDALSFSSYKSRERRSERRRLVEASTLASRESNLTSLPATVLSSRSRSGSSASIRKVRQQGHGMAQERALPVAQESEAIGSISTVGNVAVSAPDARWHNFAERPRDTGRGGVDCEDSSVRIQGTSRDTVERGTASTEMAAGPSLSPNRIDEAHSGTGNASPTLSELEQLQRAVAGLNQSNVAFLDAKTNEDEDFPLLLRVLLHPLRILAVVPGCIGTFWLARNAMLLVWEEGSVFSSGYECISSKSVARVGVAVGEKLLDLKDGGTLPIRPVDFARRQPGALDFAVSCLWSIATAHHALSFTTLLLRRWLLYYSILPSIIRLVALQAICWPLVRLTVHIFGADQPLGAWVVIGTTTAISDVVSRWVTSNIADAELEGEEDDDDEDAEEYIDQFGQIRRSTPGSHWDRAALGQSLRACADTRSGDESDVTARLQAHGMRKAGRKKGGQGTRFWRAVIGGPSRGRRKQQKKERPAITRGNVFGTETEWDGDSDWAGYGTDRLSSSPLTAQGLRRRKGVGNTSEDERDEINGRQGGSHRTILAQPPQARAGRRRDFHWDVAMRRNVLPIAALGYLSMWILILDGMRIGSGNT